MIIIHTYHAIRILQNIYTCIEIDIGYTNSSAFIKKKLAMQQSFKKKIPILLFNYLPTQAIKRIFD